MRSPALVLAAAALGACGEPAGPVPPATVAGIRLVEAARGLVVPVHVASAPGDDRIFVVEQPGRIRVLENGVLRPDPFLDLTARVGSGGERGLLSVAFHPGYADNGFFYVNFTDRAGDTRIERYRVSADPAVADPASGTLVLAVPQPFANHNGGHILFGPDGYLYVAMGDGGGGGDPEGNAQDPTTLLGALLRLDVDGATPYAVPAGNPYVAGGGRPEIWATGLRNPWRIAFDALTGTLWIADVGQGQREEIDVVPADRPGVNYGWNRFEGSRCFREPCSDEGITMPVHEYSHTDGCSVTGGAVYRGNRLAGLAGHYFFSDYCAGWIRSLRLEGGEAVDLRDWQVDGLAQVTSFGTDAAGELYLTTGDGRVLRFEPVP